MLAVVITVVAQLAAAAALAAALTAIVYYLLWRPFRIYRHLRAQGVPSEPFVPLLGQLPTFYRYHVDGRRMMFERERHDKHGKTLVASFGPFASIHTVDVRLIEDALNSRNALRYYDKGTLAKVMLAPLIGRNGLAISDEPLHMRQRRMIMPAFAHNKLSEMQAIMVEQTSALIRDWRTQLKAKISASSSTQPSIELNMHKEFTQLTFGIIISAAFGLDSASLPEAKRLVYHAYHDVFKWVQLRSIALVNVIPIVRDLPILGKTMVENGINDVIRLVDRIIEDRRAGKSSSVCRGPDLLDTLIEARDAATGEPMSVQQIREEAMTFVLAGHETTASLLTWFFHCTLSRPALLAELVDEIDSTMGAREPTAADLASLPLLDAVVQEVLRFYPPATSLSRQAIEDHELGPEGAKVHVLKGTVLLTDIVALHRQREYWGDDADEFDHTRFLKTHPSYRKPTHPLAYAPFGLGNRSCVGSNFALIEAKTVIIMLLQEFHFSLVPSQKVIVDVAITLFPRHGLFAMIEPRSDKPIATE